MSNRLILGVVLAVLALFLAACELEQEGEEPEPTTDAPATGSPTVAASATPEPTATPEPAVIATSTPTQPTPSACPPSLRKGPDEAGEPIPESELGWPRVEGSVSVGPTTLHLPAGRQFLVSPFVVKPSGPTAQPFLLIYDVQTGSVLHVTPDGCELYRSIRDLALDPVLDAIVATIEVASPAMATPEPSVMAEPTSYPTVGPSATAEALVTPTLTPEPGTCPAPVRRTSADFAQPPPTVAPSEIVGWRVQGGESFGAGFLTIRAPAGRELAVMNHWDGSEDQQYVHIVDVETQSALSLRGDGCETYRFTREPAADPIFDEVVATLEVGSVYVCPTPFRQALSQDELLPEPTGERVTGGSPEAAKFGLDLPAGREFIVWVGLADPGGGFTGLYDVATRSWLFLGEDGCETSRRIADPAADAIFDAIVGSTEVPS